jgi:E3 ubiquitin-protein ligase HERC4
METVFAEPVPASKDPEPRSLRRMASFMLDETLNEVLQNEEGKGTNAAVEEETAVELVQFSHGLIRRVGLKAGNENLVAVDASERHAVAVSSAGKIYGWGDNGDFQLALDVDNENELKDAYEVGLFASLTFGTLCQRKGGEHRNEPSAEAAELFQSALPPSLAKSTNCVVKTEADIKDVLTFWSASLSGKELHLTDEEFASTAKARREMYRKLYAKQPKLSNQYLFKCLDSNADGFLDYSELVPYVSSSLKGSSDTQFNQKHFDALAKRVGSDPKQGIGLECFFKLMERSFDLRTFFNYFFLRSPMKAAQRSQATIFARSPVLIGRISPFVKVAQVSCGYAHTAVLTTTNVVITFGSNEYGQLGHTKTKEKNSTRAKCQEGHTLKLVAGGVPESYEKHKANGKTGLCWYCDKCSKRIDESSPGGGHCKICEYDLCRECLQLENANASEETFDCKFGRSPRAIKLKVHDGRPVQVRCGAHFTVILSSLGLVWTCGKGTGGQLGLGSDLENKNTVQHVQSLTMNAISDIDCGKDHVVCVSLSGRPFSWGRNHWGQLGIGDEGLGHVLMKGNPQYLDTFRNSLKELGDYVLSVVADGSDRSYFITFRGGLYGCGANTFGQISPGSNAYIAAPIQMVHPSLGTAVEHITCSTNHTYVLTERRQIKYYGLEQGWNQDNEFAGPGQIKDIAAGENSVYAIVEKSERSNSIKRTASMFPKSKLVKPLSKSTFRGVLENCKLTGNFEPAEEQILILFSNPAALNVLFVNNALVAQSVSLGYSAVAELYTSYAGVAEMDDAFYDGTHNAILRISSVASLLKSQEELRCVLILLLNPAFLTRVPGRTLNQYIDLVNLFLLLKKPALEKLACFVMEAVPKEVIIAQIVEPLVWLLDNELKLAGRSSTAEGGTGLALAKFLKCLHSARARFFEPGEISDSSFYCGFASNMSNEYFIKDYWAWVTEEEGHGTTFTFCKHSFLLSAGAKRRILALESTIRMKQSMQNAMYRTAFGAQESPYLGITIRRANLLADSISIAGKLRPGDLRKPLKVRFHQEDGVDAGGVKREYFSLLVVELFNPDYGNWKVVGDNAYWFSSQSLDGDKIYYLVGLLAGLAIYNDVILDLHFPLALYRRLLGVKNTLEDLKEIDETIYSSLKQIKEYPGDDAEDVFCLDFEISYSGIGGEELKHDLLGANGAGTAVTSGNKGTYVDLYVEWFFERSIEGSFKAFATGFLRVVDGRALHLFTPLELEQLVEGETRLNFYELEKGAEYEGFTESHHSVLEFWSVVHTFSYEQKQKLLRFATGSGRAPIGGLSNLLPKFKLQRNGPDSESLPSAATCFSTLLLPEYSSREKLRAKLLLAIENASGFGLQ